MSFQKDATFDAYIGGPTAAILFPQRTEGTRLISPFDIKKRLHLHLCALTPPPSSPPINRPAAFQWECVHEYGCEGGEGVDEEETAGSPWRRD